jgi:hypothetical protein
MTQISSNDADYQPLSPTRGITGGGWLGYSFTTSLALEVGIFGLHSQSTYRFQPSNSPGSNYGHVTTMVYFPVHVVGKLWQPTHSLAVRAVVGAGLLIWPQVGAYDDTRVYTDTSSSPIRQFSTRYTSTGRRNIVVAEVGLRADYQLWSTVEIGLDIIRQQGLQTLEKRSTSYTDSYLPAANPTIQLTSQLRSTTVSLSTRIHFRFSSKTRYRYVPMPEAGN